MVGMFEAIAFALAVLALWDYGRRRLNTDEKIVGRLREVLASIEQYNQRLDRRDVEVLQCLNDSNEYTRSVLAGFLSSMTAIVTLSKEEKRHLENKISREGLNKVKGL
jgi:hypothetical protein